MENTIVILKTEIYGIFLAYRGHLSKDNITKCMYNKHNNEYNIMFIIILYCEENFMI